MVYVLKKWEDMVHVLNRWDESFYALKRWEEMVYVLKRWDEMSFVWGLLFLWDTVFLCFESGGSVPPGWDMVVSLPFI